MFTQSFIQTQIKENIKAPRHWPLCGECFHLMTSSWESDGYVINCSQKSLAYEMVVKNDIFFAILVPRLDKTWYFDHSSGETGIFWRNSSISWLLMPWLLGFLQINSARQGFQIWENLRTYFSQATPVQRCTLTRKSSWWVFIIISDDCTIFRYRELGLYHESCWSPGPLTWWRHQMEKFSALLAFVRGIHRSPVNSRHKGQWRGVFRISLICAWINVWVNKREAGDLGRHSAHYDVTVMSRKDLDSHGFGTVRYAVFVFHKEGFQRHALPQYRKIYRYIFMVKLHDKKEFWNRYLCHLWSLSLNMDSLFIHSCKSNNTHYKVWYKITYPLLNFNGIINSSDAFPFMCVCMVHCRSGVLHDDVTEWNYFPRYWPFVSTKASDAEVWCFLWSTPG